MKSCFESLLIALSMYSTLPVKCLNWNAKNLRLAMLFFPIVGLLCGGGLWLVWTVCQLLHRSAYLFAVPNCGPFAVFAVILVLLVQVAAYAQIYTEQNRVIIGLLTGGFWLSRCLSGISVTRFPCTPTSSLVKTFGEHAGKRVGTALIVISLLSAVGCMGCYRLLGVAACAVAGLIFWYYARMQKKQFGGVTGDLAGYFLVLCETAWLGIVALLGGISCI